MKVVSLVPYDFLPAKIGGQKGIAYFNKYFSQHIDFTCITTKTNSNELADYETIKFFPKSKFRYVNVFYYFRIRKVLIELKASHLLLEHPYFGWLGVLLRKTIPVKLIVHSHNIEALRFKTLNKWWWKILWNYERFTHRNADQNFFIHEEDRQYAIKNFGLTPSKCIVVSYGIEFSNPPSKEDVERAKKSLKEQYHIEEDEKILLFTGSFNYRPNIDALKAIENKIVSLLDKKSLKYKILICGPHLQKELHHPNIIYAGFVDDIYSYFKGADVFINAVSDGGGIKTKLVEALGLNTNSVSTKNGAIGIPVEMCNGKLAVVDNDDWHAFADAIIAISTINADVSPEYYQHFYWGYSTRKAAEFIKH